MLFTESQLGTGNAFSILDEATYLTQSEGQIQPQTVPVMEVSRLGVVQIPFYAINELAESNGCGLLEAAVAVCEADGIDPQNAVISMTEEEVILYPDVVQEVGSVIVAPISSQDEVYQFCEACIDAYAESGSEEYLNAILNEVEWGEGPLQGPITGLKDKLWGIKHHMTTENIPGRIKNVIKRNPYKTSVALMYATNGAAFPIAGPLQLYGTVNSIQKLYRKFKNRPKSVIAKKIASLRKLYETWLHRAKIERDDKTAGVMKTIATNIMMLIDKLLAFLQRKADGR